MWVLGIADAEAKAHQLSFLRAEGLHLVDESGQRVRLQGVNLGGWMVYERWLFDTGGYTWPADDLTLWLSLEDRFGARKAAELKAVFRRNFISNDDFSRIAGLGFNCVRLIFWYHDLESAPFKYRERGFRELDRAIDAAAKHGLYTVLDLHGVPGGQSTADHTGWAGRNALWKDPLAQERTNALWEKLARRYRDRAEVAGYDLMNEPMGAPSLADIVKIMDRIYQAVRKHDRRHIIFIEEGYKGLQDMPLPADKDWENVVYSFHHYPFGKTSPEAQEKHLEWLAGLRQEQLRLQVPIFVGEFSAVEHGTGGFDLYGEFLQRHREYGWSWCLHTWKRPLSSPSPDIWAVLNQPKGKGWKPFGVLTDSFERIRAGFKGMHSRNFGMSEGMRKLLASHLRPDL